LRNRSDSIGGQPVGPAPGPAIVLINTSIRIQRQGLEMTPDEQEHGSQQEQAPQSLVVFFHFFRSIQLIEPLWDEHDIRGVPVVVVEGTTHDNSQCQNDEDQDERIRNTPFFLCNGFHR
jgi:hypothetical protein